MAKIKLFSHRDLIEAYFKNNSINIATVENFNKSVDLTELEELVLFMLLAGFTQKEIGALLGFSRTYILKIIAEGLCVKFELNMVSTKSLIEKASALEYTRLVPSQFCHTVNENDCILYTVDTTNLIDNKHVSIVNPDDEIQLKLFSHRNVVEAHFKHYTDIGSTLKDFDRHVELTEQEEMVLFMLLAGLTQKEIGDLLGFSRTYILKIIGSKLCTKFNLITHSTKSLIEKAVSLGYTRLVPTKFLQVFN